MGLRGKLRRFANKAYPQRRMRAATLVHHELQMMGAAVPQHLLDGAQLLTDREELLKRLPKGAVVAEIGVSEGAFAEMVLDICAPRKYYLIDAWHMDIPQFGEPAFRKVNERFASQIATGQVELLRGWSWDKIAELDDEALDWAYLDAGHEYKDVSKDMDALAPKIKPGGLLCGHDYVKWTRGFARFGVVEAVNMQAKQNDWPFAYLTIDQKMNGSFALKRPL